MPAARKKATTKAEPKPDSEASKRRRAVETEAAQQAEAAQAQRDQTRRVALVHRRRRSGR